MPSLINRVPPGLLSLLDIKALGQNPSLLTDSVQPTIDLSEFYARIYSSLVTDLTVVPGTVGFQPVTAFDTAPGEMVVLAGLGCLADSPLAAGTSVRCTPVIADQATGRVLSQIAPETSGTAGEQPYTGTDQLVTLGPGTRLGVMISALTLGTGPRLRISARVLRLRV